MSRDVCHSGILGKPQKGIFRYSLLPIIILQNFYFQFTGEKCVGDRMYVIFFMYICLTSATLRMLPLVFHSFSSRNTEVFHTTNERFNILTRGKSIIVRIYSTYYHKETLLTLLTLHYLLFELSKYIL